MRKVQAVKGKRGDDSPLPHAGWPRRRQAVRRAVIAIAIVATGGTAWSSESGGVAPALSNHSTTLGATRHVKSLKEQPLDRQFMPRPGRKIAVILWDEYKPQKDPPKDTGLSDYSNEVRVEFD